MSSSGDDLLRSSDFECCLFPPREFRFVAEKIQIGDDLETAVSLVGTYDRHAGFRLASGIEVHPAKLLTGQWPDAQLSGADLPEAVTLLLVSLQSERTVFLPRIQPVLVDRRKPARRVEAVMTNGPSLRFCNSQLRFEVDGYELVVKEFPKLKEFRDEAKLYRNDCLATGIISMSAMDGSAISADVAFRTIGHLTRFLGFARGGHCGLGNIRGEDESGELAFIYLGFGKCDAFWVEEGWCDREVIARSPAIYPLYSRAVSDPDDAEVLLRAIDYYRAGNVSRSSSPELALVASYAALETLVPYILSSRGGWSKNLLGRQTSFGDMLRAAASFIGITADVMEHSPKMLARAKADANGDAYEMLALLRNRITHHKKGFRYSGLELMEVWQVSQWLCELMLLYCIGYRGVMNDRRRYLGFRGPAVAVPLK